MSKSYIIYKATNLINGKCYVGKTINGLKDRKRQHIRNTKDNVYFHNALRKYGADGFAWRVLFECDDLLLLNVMETFKIMVCHSHKSEGGYNLTWGGDGSYGYRHSLKSIEKMKTHPNKVLADAENKIRMMKNNPNMDGHTFKGKNHTDKAKMIMSEKKKNYIPWNKGKKVQYSEEHLENIRKANKKRACHNN